MLGILRRSTSNILESEVNANAPTYFHLHKMRTTLSGKTPVHGQVPKLWNANRSEGIQTDEVHGARRLFPTGLWHVHHDACERQVGDITFPARNTPLRTTSNARSVNCLPRCSRPPLEIYLKHFIGRCHINKPHEPMAERTSIAETDAMRQ